MPLMTLATHATMKLANNVMSKSACANSKAKPLNGIRIAYMEVGIASNRDQHAGGERIRSRALYTTPATPREFVTPKSVGNL